MLKYVIYCQVFLILWFPLYTIIQNTSCVFNDSCHYDITQHIYFQHFTTVIRLNFQYYAASTLVQTLQSFSQHTKFHNLHITPILLMSVSVFY